MKETWDKRYNSNEFVYGVKPNEFLKSILEKIKPGTILLPGDGEGRNSVFAAKLGWKVDAFDYSLEGYNKAKKLAKKNNADINYFISDVSVFDTKIQYDFIAIIFLHLPPEIRASFFKNLVHFLKPGGYILLEAFSREQIQNTSGGPKDVTLLYDLQEIKEDFQQLTIELAEEKKIILDEGKLHQGKASVIRLLAKKD
ncbi:MAG: hypothetical protein A2X13_03965 [Bacteroidetes bacterium GWC2_33_15]|nr:MAG: hypothetical protein A2X10_00730 [Bacteroidetes bacterium GWA2_33_15]OFX49679.1 MAG: hypothetical protein A2X13_03965 [Bacteroidetes bacterium GWC2_33_15]OFX65931.1 MAG: hypothetical protein A2X15_10870 [Bacteroidetes bacterium GWB2_32_14]OFX68308.1 MAG: hypothetical protein A2X14_08025 [Bacteroidetes bacterium GWD2_33_33]HAN18092.1 SAM-dependent methyltransferase [Bacteroidales bacterium]